METLVNVQLTPLTETELTTIEGGGLLTSLATSAGAITAGLVLSAAGTLGSARDTTTNLLTFLI
ncbi:MAG TPA: hypothetical protein VGE90_10845 [Chitinophaga sp.]